MMCRYGCSGRSLPSRGAWVEIDLCKRLSGEVIVAPLAGSVGRNYVDFRPSYGVRVAPLAGSVGRNKRDFSNITTINGRSPRGERG